MTRILAGDPARTGDYFAFVGIEVDRFRISVRFANQFKGTFMETAHAMEDIIRLLSPDYFALETNNEGEQAVRAFEALGFSPLRIQTAGELTAKKARDYHCMSKPKMVGWLRSVINAENAWSIQFPPHEISSPMMRALVTQIAMYGEYRQLSGTISYKARSGHDDLVSAFLLACHVAVQYEAGSSRVQ